jgi:hypothetical protein
MCQCPRRTDSVAPHAVNHDDADGGGKTKDREPETCVDAP